MSIGQIVDLIGFHWLGEKSRFSTPASAYGWTTDQLMPGLSVISMVCPLTPHFSLSAFCVYIDRHTYSGE